MTAALKDHPQINWLQDGKRLQMRHGPIDLIVRADGPPADVRIAYRQAVTAFMNVLAELSGELAELRRPLADTDNALKGAIAQNMWCAASNVSSGRFVTPMIAVAGAVADHILAHMTSGTSLTKAFVNNGGDIALHLAPGQSFDVGVCSDPATGAIVSTARIAAQDGIGGIATSGWRGRSHSLGIADAVTIFACNAATADTAATLIANAIDLPDHPAIERLKAHELSPDSDLGARLVTVGVASLLDCDVNAALGRGRRLAQDMLDQGHISSAFACLQSQMFTVTNGPRTDILTNQRAGALGALGEAAYA